MWVFSWVKSTFHLASAANIIRLVSGKLLQGGITILARGFSANNLPGYISDFFHLSRMVKEMSISCGELDVRISLVPSLDTVSATITGEDK